jgi:class 3 adenylate cyclase/tetratricopeptide (TPR) repeat protein
VRADERRVTTVLFADLVGFTALAEHSDPENMKRMVDDCFDRLAHDITDFGGQVDKVLGDGILALFGAPVAHEDDAERAVRAALRMQNTVEEFCAETDVQVQLRIGVNTGEVLVGAIRADGDYTAMGDVVNTASRLQEAAEPGTVVVGPLTHAATRRIINYTSHLDVEVRGREESVESWVASDALLPPGYKPDRPETPLVGRQPEWDLLNAAVSAAFRTQRPAIILLVGDAGLGKTRLAEAVLESARRDHGALSLSGRCVPYGESNVFWPIAEVLRDGFQLDADADQATTEATVLSTLAAAYNEAEDSAQVQEVAVGMLRLLGIESAGPEVDPQRARDQAVSSTVSMFQSVFSQLPTIIRIADLHWADDLVLEYLDQVLSRAGRVPLVYIATSRADIEERWSPGSTRHNVLVLHLDPLSDGASAELLDHLSDRPLDPDLRQLLVERSGGNPFFLEELVSLVGAEAEDGEQSPLRRLPETLRGLLAARIDALDADQRAVVQDASVFGTRGVVEGLHVMGRKLRKKDTVDPELKALVSGDVLKIDGPSWEFRNDLMREVAYHTLTKADRARRHWGIAAHLAGYNEEPLETPSGHFVDVVAHHMASAAELIAELGPVRETPDNARDLAVVWLRTAATRAVEGGYLSKAAPLFRRALDLAPLNAPERHLLEMGIGEVLIGTSELDEAGRMLTSAAVGAAEAGDGLSTARIAQAEGTLLLRRGDYGGAIERYRDARESFADLGDHPRSVDALREMGLAHLFQGEFEAANDAVMRALEGFRELDDPHGQAWAFQNLAWIAYVSGDQMGAAAYVDASEELFEEVGDRSGLAWALGLRAFVWFHQGRFDEAGALAAQVRDAAEERGDRWAGGIVRTLEASLALWTGRTSEAARLARLATASFGESDELQGRILADATLGRALVMLGEVDEGFATFDGMLERSDLVHLEGIAGASAATSAVLLGDTKLARRYLRFDPASMYQRALGEREVSVALGLLAVMEGDPRKGVELIAPLVESDGAGVNVADVDPSAQATYAVALLACGQPERAAEVATEAIGAPRSTYADRALAQAVVGLRWALEPGDSAAIAAFDAAWQEVEETGDVVLQAIVRLAAARALRLLGVEGSAAALEAALGRFQAIGVDGSGWVSVFDQVSITA